MKKILVIALAVIMMVSALALVACGPQEKVAYGIVHKSYVGKATVTISGGKMTAANLDEAQQPTVVTATDAIEGYTVTIGEGDSAKHYYKTVKFAGVTAEFDAAANEGKGAYKVGGKVLLDWLKESEANCEQYFEAVASDSVSVVLASGEDKTIMTSAKLLKSKCGYWDGSKIKDGQLGWKANVEATCNYVVENGFGGASAKEDFVKGTGEGADGDQFSDKNGVKTGATWTDMWDYFVVLKAAYEK